MTEYKITATVIVDDDQSGDQTERVHVQFLSWLEQEEIHHVIGSTVSAETSSPDQRHCWRSEDGGGILHHRVEGFAKGMTPDDLLRIGGERWHRSKGRRRAVNG